MQNLRNLQREIQSKPKYWPILLMDFVDDFRHYRELKALKTPLDNLDNRWAALLAATAEALCLELRLRPPAWIAHVTPCRSPWFVSGLESLKAIALVESPLPFRRRKIFVLANFLARA